MACSNSMFCRLQFDEELRRKWDQAEQNGYFRYKLDIEDTKVFEDNKYICQVPVCYGTSLLKNGFSVNTRYALLKTLCIQYTASAELL